MKVDKDTLTSDILAAPAGRMALMLRLATLMFDRTGGASFRAFTQFGEDGLATIIDARRAGTFDYGSLIVDVDGVVTFPRNTEAMLRMAKTGEPDLAALLEGLGLEEGDSLPVDMQNVFPWHYSEKAVATTEDSTPIKKDEEPISTTQKAVPLGCSEDDCDRKVKARGLCSKHYSQMRAREKEGSNSSVANRGTSLTLEQVEAALDNALSPVMAALDKLLDPSTSVLASIEGNGSLIKALHVDMQRALTDFVGPDFVWSADVVVGAAAEGAEERGQEAWRTAALASVHEDGEGETVPEDGGHVVHDGSGKDCSYCEDVSTSQGSSTDASQEHQLEDIPDLENLENMGLAELRAIGERLGVAPARFKKVMISRIIKASGSMP